MMNDECWIVNKVLLLTRQEGYTDGLRHKVASEKNIFDKNS